MTELIGVLVGLGFLAIFILYKSFSWGFVLYKFWYWFLLPVFTELPEINFYEAVGLMLFLSLFKNNKVTENENEKINWKQVFLLPWLTLLIGLLIHNVI